MGRHTLTPVSFKVETAPGTPARVRLAYDAAAGGQLLSRQGMVLTVSIGLDLETVNLLQSKGGLIPTVHTCLALVDTGASGLAIDNSVVSALGLLRKGTTTNHTAAGARQASVYFVALSFPNTNLKSYPLLRATDVNLGSQPFKCLIGRETMQNWHLHYNGDTGHVSISD